MIILITNNNIDFFKEIHPKAKVEQSTQSTSIIRCTVKTFEKIRTVLKDKGLNPYTYMAW